MKFHFYRGLWRNFIFVNKKPSLLTKRLAVAVILVSSSLCYARSSSEWFRIVTDAESFANEPGIPFAVAMTEYKDYRLSAVCWLRYTVGGEPVVLRGEKRPDGMFSPRVSYEVAVLGKSKWKKINADLEQSDSGTVTVGPENPIVKLRVDMQPFQKAIGIYRYGRLVLENGYTAVFQIEDLLPTVDARSATSGFKEIVFQSDAEKRTNGYPDRWLNRSIHLFAITSFGNQLTGDCIVEAPTEKRVNLEGAKTSDGDFWPAVKFEVAGDDFKWRGIGESRRKGVQSSLEVLPGKSERIRVSLVNYDLRDERSKYARIVFSNGQDCIFSLESLRP